MRRPSDDRLKIRFLVLTLTLALGGCGGSPSSVVEDLGEHAEKRRLVQFRKLFSARATETLRRRWREDGLSESAGWLDLMRGYLGSDREPPEVLGEEIKGENSAVVKVAKELKKQNTRIIQDLFLVKEDDDIWRLDIGEMVYVEEDLETGKVKEAAKELPLGDDDDWGLDGEEKPEQAVEDFDLDEF